MAFTLEVSVFSKFGDSSSCQIIAGTPPMVVMRSRSMSSSARSGSHLYMITSLAPNATELSMMA